MAVKAEIRHDVETVYETLADPQFLVDRCLALGELEAECEVEEVGDVTVVKMVRKIQRDLPRVLARVFGDEQVTEMAEEWQPDGEGWRGHWTMTVQGQPVTIEADFRLEPTGSGCRYTVSHRANARIPVVGRQVEKFILSQTSGGATDELDYLKDFLG
jgi:hypothetical protein